MARRMRTAASLLFLALTLPLAAENLFDNSAMDTAGAWKGSKKFVVEDQKDAGADSKENRVLCVSGNKRERVSFSQKVPLRGLTDLIVKFRYRTKDYAGRGLEIRGMRPGGSSTFINRQFEVDDKWHQVEWKFTQVNGANSVEFMFIVLEGEGDVFFDDVTVESAR